MAKFFKPVVIVLTMHVVLLGLASQRDISRILPALVDSYGVAISTTTHKEETPSSTVVSHNKDTTRPVEDEDTTELLLERHRRELNVLLQQAVNRSKNGRNQKWRLHKTIFMFWDSGIDNGPWWIKWTWQSWKVMNPTYKHVFLDNNNMQKWFPEYDAVMNRSTLELEGAQKSDYLRLYLLSKYGGVWADATTFCVLPLDNWLPDLVKKHGGVFLPFTRLYKDRQIMSWFIAADKHEETLTRMLMSLHERITRPRPKKLSVIVDLERVTTKHPSLLQMVGPNETDSRMMDALEDSKGRFPYFMFHYTLNQILKDFPRLQAKFPDNHDNSRSAQKHWNDFATNNRVRKKNRRKPNQDWKRYVKTIFNVTDPMIEEPTKAALIVRV